MTASRIAKQSSSARWHAYYQEFSVHVGYRCLWVFSAGRYLGACIKHRLAAWTFDKKAASPVFKPPTLKPQRSWHAFWCDLRDYSIKQFYRILGHFILPALETAAKWQLISWIVLTMVSTGFQLPYVGLKSLLLLGAGISAGCGYYQYHKNIVEELQVKTQIDNQKTLKELQARINTLESKIIRSPAPYTPSAVTTNSGLKPEPSTTPLNSVTDQNATLPPNDEVSKQLSNLFALTPNNERIILR